MTPTGHAFHPEHVDKSGIIQASPEQLQAENRFISHVAKQAQIVDQIDPAMYDYYNVKRGLRDPNGAGVVVGLTRIGNVDGYQVVGGQKAAIPGKLYYRGIDIEDIVHACWEENRFGYEETSYLLLFGQLPTQAQLLDYMNVLGSRRELPPGFARDMILNAPSPNVMNKLSRGVLALYSYDNDPEDLSIENQLRQSINLIGYFPTLIAYGWQAKRTYYHNESLHLHYPDPELSTAQNFLRMIRPTGEFSDEEAKILDLCLILHAEHGGGNNSSFTVHLVSSTCTDIYSAIAAGVCSLKGPLHGGANLYVLQMIEDIKANVKDITDEKELTEYVIKIINKEAGDRTGKLYGLGHAVYTISDPRAKLLKKTAKRLAKNQNKMDDFMLYDFIEKRGAQIFQEIKGLPRPLPANVDLYSGFVYQALGIPNDIVTPLFATARISGWCAHRLEEIVAGGKLMRPAYQCVQPLTEYVPISLREE
jgi:citrate synthase